MAEQVPPSQLIKDIEQRLQEIGHKVAGAAEHIGYAAEVASVTEPVWRAMDQSLQVTNPSEINATNITIVSGQNFTVNFSIDNVGGSRARYINLSITALQEAEISSNYFEFNEILRNFSKLKTTRVTSLSQTVQSYRNWLKGIENKPKAGRKFALYQDLSSAYVIGSQLKDLPSEALPYTSAPIRKAGKVAEQLMLSCL